MEVAEYLKTVTAAAREAGITHLQLRWGPLASAVILPAERPVQGEKPEEREDRAAQRAREDMFGRPRPGRARDVL